MGEEADSVEGGIGATPVNQAPVLDGPSVKVSGGGKEMDGQDLNAAAKAADAGADPFKEFLQSEAGQRVDGWLRTLADVQTLQGSIQGVMNGHPEQLFNVLRSVVNLDSRLLDGKILKTASSIISRKKSGKTVGEEGGDEALGEESSMMDATMGEAAVETTTESFATSAVVTTAEVGAVDAGLEAVTAGAATPFLPEVDSLLVSVAAGSTVSSGLSAKEKGHEVATQTL